MPAIQDASLFFTSDVIAPSMQFLFDHAEATLASAAETMVRTNIRRIYGVGGGASLSALMGLQYLLGRYSELDMHARNGWEVPTGARSLAGTAIVATSYSGQTPEVLDTVRRARDAGAFVLALTDSDASPLAGLADVTVAFRSKAVYIAPLTAVYLLGAHLLRLRGESGETAAQLRRDLHRFPDRAGAIRVAAGARAEALAGDLADHYYVVAGGPQYGLGYKLALSVIIENLWTHATILHSGEFYHGPMEIVHPGGPTFVLLLGEDATRPAAENVVRFLDERQASVLTFDSRHDGSFSELMAPYPLFIATELWVMWMAAKMGHDVDERRYMGKVSATWGAF